jgi:hypothetical protein
MAEPSIPTKRCTVCKEMKPLSEFYTDSRRADGCRSDCKDCTNASGRKRREDKPEYYRDYHRNYARQWREDNRDHFNRLSSEGNRRRHGERYRQMFNAQNGLCAICQAKLGSRRRVHLDHDHATGKRRGLLCVRCNQLLGNANDDPCSLRQAIAYLLQHGVKDLVSFPNTL